MERILQFFFSAGGAFVANEPALVVATYNKYVELGWGMERILQFFFSAGGAFIAQNSLLVAKAYQVLLSTLRKTYTGEIVVLENGILDLFKCNHGTYVVKNYDQLLKVVRAYAGKAFTIINAMNAIKRYKSGLDLLKKYL